MVIFHVIAAPRRLSQATAAGIMESFKASHRHLQFIDLDRNGANFFVTGDDAAAVAFIAHLKQHARQEEDENECFFDTTQDTSKVLHPLPDSNTKQQLVGAQVCIWKPDPRNASYRPHASILDRIGQLTGCSIQTAEGTSLAIRGEIIDSVDATINKLNVINKVETVAGPLFQNILRGDCKLERLVFRSVSEVKHVRSLSKATLKVERSHDASSVMLLILPMGNDGLIQAPSESKRALQTKALWQGFDWPPIGLTLQENEGTIKLELSESLAKPTCSDGSDIESEPAPIDVQTVRRVRQVQGAKPAQQRNPKQPLNFARLEMADVKREMAQQSFFDGHECFGGKHSRYDSAICDISSAVASHPSPDEDANAQNQSLLDTMTDDQKSFRNSCSSLPPSNAKPQERPSPRENRNAELRYETKHIVSLLRLARGHPSPTRFQLNFGRLLIHPESVSKKARNRPIAESLWAPQSQESNKLKTVFSSRLTQVQAEAESILDIKLRRGRDAFANDPQRRIVRFEVLCRAESGEEICIGFSEGGAPTVGSMHKTLGGFNLHYPKSFWDARIAIETSPFMLGEYGPEAASISNSFKVRPVGLDTAIVSVRCMNTSLKILYGRAIRETSHRSLLYPDLVLRLTEYRDMQLHAQIADILFYDGNIRTCAELAGSDQVWWEASVSSSKIDSLIENGLSHELGDLAAWVPEDIATDGTIVDMLSMADDIVPRMDHIGTLA